MADAFAPPAGPPPPKLPEGWKAQFNEQYQEWFYVNIYTKQSQWNKPNEPVYPPGEQDHVAPPGPPPSYGGYAQPVAAEKTGLSSNNPYASPGAPGARGSQDISEDERLARQLQAEEDSRSRDRGASDQYYQNSPGGQYGGQQYGGQQYPGQQSNYGYDQGQLPPRPDDGSRGKKGGFLGKLLGKSSGSSSQPQQYGGYPQQQPQYYGGQPQGAYGYGPQQGAYGGGGMQAQRPARHGLGTGGGLALGAGGGLLGGMLLGEAMSGGDDGGDDGGGDGGGDFGGGDGGGGD